MIKITENKLKKKKKSCKSQHKNVTTFSLYPVSQKRKRLLLSIQHIPFDEYSNFRHFHLTIIAALFRERSLLRNSTLITSHLTVLQTNNFTIDVLLRIF